MAANFIGCPYWGVLAISIFSPAAILPITPPLHVTYRVQTKALNIWHRQMTQGCRKCSVSIAGMHVIYEQRVHLRTYVYMIIIETGEVP